MLVFIQNSPRTYAWGSTDALANVLRQPRTGEPQAELWLGDHAGDPAEVTRGGAEPITLIQLIAQDPDAYGVDGGPLPFLLKVLGIGAPLSIQVHPRLREAAEGFRREEAAGIPIDAPHRNYRDANHKPELLVALTPVRALTGFRSTEEVYNDLGLIARNAGTCGAAGSQSILSLASTFSTALRDGPERAREAVFDWAFSGGNHVAVAASAIGRLARDRRIPGLDETRRSVLELIDEHHPGDAGILISLLMNVMTLDEGEAIFLDAGQLHAYLSGVGVEVMASSDNVLRAGLTRKHVDVEELRRIVDLRERGTEKFLPQSTRIGLLTWQPPVPDFVLHRVRVERDAEDIGAGTATSVSIAAPYPLVMITTEGLLRVERTGETSCEVANVAQGQSLYISAGDPVEISGAGEAFLATVGSTWACRNSHVVV